MTSSPNTVRTPEPGAGLMTSVGATADRLQRNYLDLGHAPAGAEARADLAKLRKFSSQDVAASPLALEHVLLMMRPPLSERELGRGSEPSPSERAAFHALTLFGVHMQSSTKPMHAQGTPFTGACGQLYGRSTSKSIKPRFDAMQAASDEVSRVTHLRSLITLLRSQGIAFDYGRFASDLRALSYPAKRNGVLLRWGRDFARGAHRGTQQEPSTLTS